MSQSGDYAWRTRRPSTRAQENASGSGDPGPACAHAANLRPRAVPNRMACRWVPCWGGADQRLRKKLGLRCQQIRRFTTTTDSTHALPVAENVLAQTFATRRPNEAWVTDITYVPTVEGWLYLAGVKDLYTCEVVGHAMDARMTTDLVQGTRMKAIDTRRPAPGLIHHSVRGAQ